MAELSGIHHAVMCGHVNQQRRRAGAYGQAMSAIRARNAANVRFERDERGRGLRRFGGPKISQVVGAGSLALLSIQSLPVGSVSGAIFPPTVLLGILSVPILAYERRRLWRSPISVAVVMFVSFALVQSCVVFLLASPWETTAGQASPVAAALRQLVALGTGTITYFVARYYLTTIRFKVVLRLIVLSFAGSIVVAIFGVLADNTGSSALSSLTIGIRSLAGATGYLRVDRASGLALEPSYFGMSLAIVFFPAIVLLLQSPAKALTRVALWLLLIAALLTIVKSSSATGLLTTFAFGATYGAMRLASRSRMNRWRAAGVMFLLFAALVYLPRVIPSDSYLGRQVLGALSYLEEPASGYLSTSLADSVYSTVGPAVHAVSPRGFWGYGLGGGTTMFYDILPGAQAITVARTKRVDAPNLGTLVGRVIADHGVPGLALFLAIFFAMWRVLRGRGDSSGSYENARAALMGGVVACFVATLVKYGSYALPYFWILAALSDRMGINESGDYE